MALHVCPPGFMVSLAGHSVFMLQEFLTVQEVIVAIFDFFLFTTYSR